MLSAALRIGFGTATLVAGGWAVRALQGTPSALGASPVEIDGVAKKSPNYKDGAFVNLEPASPVSLTRQEQFLLVREVIGGSASQHPRKDVPLVTPDPSLAAGDLAVTWYGHSSAVIEIDGYRVLADPVWSDRCSPSSLVGPRRMHPVPIPLADLPRLDAIAISHDHYDHLDMPTIRELVRTQSAPFLVPLGVAAHLDRWGVPPERIVELDWNESVDVAGLHFVATAARHFSGRGFARDGTLWASWVLTGAQRRVFYTGDSGYWDGYAEIGAKHGPFDVTMIQIGAYGPGWPDIHMTPEDGAAAHLDVRGDLLIPLHWCTFNLAIHSWAEPADRLWREAKARDIRLAIPRPGERVDVDDPPAVDGWWQAIA